MDNLQHLQPDSIPASMVGWVENNIFVIRTPMLNKPSLVTLPCKSFDLIRVVKIVVSCNKVPSHIVPAKAG